MNGLVRKVLEKGPRGVFDALQARVARPVHLPRARHGAESLDPTDSQLAQIESGLRELGIVCKDYRANGAAYAAFKSRIGFPVEHHGGMQGGIYDEKLLEHYVAWDLLELEDPTRRWPYVDIASASSAWASLLRAQGLEAFSMDLAPLPSLAHLDYTLKADATASPFGAASVGSASLQCAYEMFVGDADTRLLRELARILRPGGRVVISPLYTRVEACYYQSPEHFGQPIGDANAKAFVRRHVWGVQASRKYSPSTLLTRVWEPAHRSGLVPSLRVLRNKRDFGAAIYLHFILVLDKPLEASK